MSFAEILRLVWINLLGNRFKVLLTSLGIIVGSATIVIVIGIGQGGQQDVAEQFKNLNAGTITISDNSQSSSSGGMGSFGGMPAMGGGMPSGGGNRGSSSGGMPSFSGGGMPAMGGFPGMEQQRVERTTFDNDDLDEINYFISNIEQTTLMASATTSVDGGTMDEESDMTVVGANNDYLDITNMELLYGSFFDEDGEENLDRTAILGYQAAIDIFENIYDAYDSTILINGKKYTVIGVLEQTNSTVSDITLDSSIYIPLASAKKDVMGSSYSPKIIVIAEDVGEIEDTISDLEQLLAELHPNGSFDIADSGSQVTASQKSADTLSFMLIAVASIVFIVGGIGIMNVLFVTVKERTKEIGLLKALGSSKKDILLQFLLEANFISLFGGIIGVLLSFILIPLISSFGTTIVQSAFNVVLALAFAIFTGTVFGFYPAWQAASLKPIEALNQE